MPSQTTLVCLSRQENYDVDELKALIRNFLDQMSISKDALCGKRVVIKPNLVRKMDASLGGTTHPAVLEAVAAVLLERGASDLLLAESPGGIYTEATLRAAYRVCGMEEVCRRVGIRLNEDTSAVYIDAADGLVSKNFHIIRPIAEADVIVNLCKLKSHGLTMMTGAIKNYFGTIPGTEKFEMHARFPDLKDFSGMLTDLCYCHTQRALTLNITDAVVGMEGNGPTNGVPRKLGFMAASVNPFALDAVCADILGMDGRVEMLKIAAERGYYMKSEISVLGESPEKLRIPDFQMPDSSIQTTSILSNAKMLKIFQPKPEIDRRVCVGCGECVRSCPRQVITLNPKSRKAKISHSDCIRCFCCQELCPHDAVRIRRNLLLRWIR